MRIILFKTVFTLFIVAISGRQFRVTDQVYLDIEVDDEPLGRIVIGLFGDLAPKAVKNFKVLATKGIKGKSYKRTIFTRVIKRFMVQGGDIVSNDGYGSLSIYGEKFDDENLDTEHTGAGFVSMANKGKNTNGCQFIITVKGTPWLDGLHTVIGKVVEGQKVVHLMENTPTDMDDRPTKRIVIADCGLVPTDPYYISDNPYDVWGWIKASAAPLSMSFSILAFFHWMIRKMEIK
ncbi:peptidyl-prolyl cis-trans isomerase, rhodopsin-specific isozyme-like [Aricia agestis]|uniref:peptidyl-prolyl cis-trans isomerase, rhodopsin-specific isozyme-like n=1 Tax=Aricia agestis TaxID=91739 RepID=UPI001C204BBA|nr:peptidyl-prolyl cis-trans isomerase, rhodopsin-specific isozyme-like [Aricia agestis]XP_041987213.1 peptidyl-prolyl cis-trans isomerase, rhodopsin-specific isozyme-like [Aricia agestis]